MVPWFDGACKVTVPYLPSPAPLTLILTLTSALTLIIAPTLASILISGSLHGEATLIARRGHHEWSFEAHHATCLPQLTCHSAFSYPSPHSIRC